MTPSRHIEVYRSKGLIRRFRFRVVSRNGQKMDSSQAYTRRWSAKRAAMSLHPDLPVVDVK